MSGESNRYIVQVYVGALSLHYEALSVEASKQTTSEEIVVCIVERLSLKDSPSCYELAEVIGDSNGVECKERRLGGTESPVQLMLLWPKLRDTQQEYYRFYLREKLNDCSWGDQFSMDSSLIRDYLRSLYHPKDREYPDLCQLPDLNEQTLLDNLRARFTAGHIYTYVGSILIALNPFKFYPIYNPKYVKLYQNRRLGSELPPHIFAVADAAYNSMLKERRNQCIVISGESGSGKTESTNFLLHHLTALSQKGSHGCGVEQTILSAGPVLEAFGNAKTAHNNNSSRFGKFIQVNYKENGMVHGAVVQKYLLEKSRICSQGRNERNYHVFYYLLVGASEADRKLLHLCRVQDYSYLNKSGCYTLDNVDEKYEFSRLKQSMEMVGFNADKQRRLFSVLSAVLLLGNVEFRPRKSTYHHDEAVAVSNPEVVQLISELLSVKQETLLAALTAKRARASGETLVINYRLPEAVAARDAMAKCLYGALFDWIVLQLNHALLYKKDVVRMHHQGHSIGVLDIFGFEDLGNSNSFEQLCINYANEHLQFYFNQHVFKYEQEEYRKEHIRWNDIAFMDNTGCLYLIEGKPCGLFCVLDDQCNFPGASTETLVHKFNTVHKENLFYETPQRREAAFIIRHYAGRVKYQMVEMREKNLDLMRQDIVGVLKNSSMAFVRELVGADPVAVFRWAIVRAFFRGYFAFHEAGRRHRQGRAEGNKNSMLQQRFRHHTPNESLISRRRQGSWSTSPSSPELRYTQRKYSSKHNQVDESPSQVMEKANQIVMKNKSFRPRDRGKKGLKNLQSVKTLAGRTQAFSSGTVAKRKQPLTVTAQFQLSLHSLMDTLNMANPFFIRCIKSNGQKIPNSLDEETVQRQLRYTGMLETVRIRQAGYNVRLTYDEFIQGYRILLPKGLLSSQADVKHFMATLNLNRDNYQLGMTKIFLRENEKTQLDYRLHQQIMAAIVAIQRWFRACLERRKFVRWRGSARIIQSFWRRVLAHKVQEQMQAATQIQAAVRGFFCRKWYRGLQKSTPKFQACCRGLLARKTAAEMREQLQQRRKTSLIPDIHIHPSENATRLVSDDMDAEVVLRHPRGHEARPDIVVGDPNQGVPSRKKLAVRKGSCDSLVSAKEDSGLKDRAKKQLQSLLRGGKGKSDKLRLYLAYSDGELDEGKTDVQLNWLSRVNGSQSSAGSTRVPTGADTEAVADDDVDRIDNIDNTDNIDKAVKSTREYRRQQSLTDDRGEVYHARKNALRRSPLGPGPTRAPRKQRRSKGEQKEASHSMDAIDPDRNWPYGHEPVYQRTASDPSARNSDPSAQTPTYESRVLPPLDRRNSDLEPPGDVIEWKGRTMFTISGHRFRKVSKFSKQDRCVFCETAMDPFLTQGHKCSDCKQLFHTKCIQNGGVLQMPCQRKNRKPVRAQYEVKPPSSTKFSLTGTSEFTDSTDKIISDATELQKMQDFITRKIYKMECEAGTRPSEVDRVFKQALREFKDNLVATYSVATRHGDSLNIKYKDLITNFVHVMKTVCNSEDKREDFSVTMGVNAFRGFMNEFMALSRFEPDKTDKLKSSSSQSKRKKEKKRPKSEDSISYNGHVFVLTIINIPTACEVCSNFFMWPIERSLVCQNCKVTCHKKCYQKTASACRLDSEGTHGAGSREHRVFGVPLHQLAPDGKVPPIVDRLITTIEMYGLYTEGIYRKSGVSSKVKELKARMDESQLGDITLDKYQVHVLASVLKSFLREMPEPLLTFDCYEDFLRAADLTDHHDRVSTLFAILNKLPTPNFHLMERLVFHLARVASQEESNRMNPSSLAIVFAPCVLRTNKHIPAQDSLHDIAQQTQCIETIISDQLKKVKSTLADIDTLDTACHTATYRLSSLRSSKIFTAEELLTAVNHAVEPADQSEDEEALLVGHIHEIQKEKALLTSTLPSLTRTTSDDDLLSTDMDDGSIDDALHQTGVRIGAQESQEDPVMV